MTWVLIADGGRARILKNNGPGSGLEEVPGMTFSRELPATHELARDRQPRSFESVGPARHPIDTGLDLHRKEKEIFAGELAAVIEHELRKGSFDALVVVAPAKAMGELREAFSEKVRAKVSKELVADLTKTPDAELVRHLADVIRL